MLLRRVKPQARWREGGGPPREPPGDGDAGGRGSREKGHSTLQRRLGSSRAEELAAAFQRCRRGYSSCVYNVGKASADVGGQFTTSSLLMRSTNAALTTSWFLRYSAVELTATSISCTFTEFMQSTALAFSQGLPPRITVVILKLERGTLEFSRG